MDELLRDFLTETNESIDVIDVELVRFEREPDNAKILGNIFRLVHTIKGTCGFLNLPRLEALAHAAETLMSKFRSGMPVTADAVNLILFAIDRIKDMLAYLEKHQREHEGPDTDLIRNLVLMAEQDGAPATQSATLASGAGSIGVTVPQTPKQPPHIGEASLDDLERAFRETPGPSRSSVAPAASAPKSEPEKPPAG